MRLCHELKVIILFYFTPYRNLHCQQLFPLGNYSRRTVQQLGYLPKVIWLLVLIFCVWDRNEAKNLTSEELYGSTEKNALPRYCGDGSKQRFI